VVPVNVIGDPPPFMEAMYYRSLADALLPVEGYVTAQELAETPDDIQPIVDLLEDFVESGIAKKALANVGDDKQWCYSRNHEH
jgi:hypothetical protein